jgi:hypothetical protein
MNNREQPPNRPPNSSNITNSNINALRRLLPHNPNAVNKILGKLKNKNTTVKNQFKINQRKLHGIRGHYLMKKENSINKSAKNTRKTYIKLNAHTNILNDYFHILYIDALKKFVNKYYYNNKVA